MVYRIKNRLHNSSIYWNVKKRYDRSLIFNLFSNGFSIRHKWREEKMSAYILRRSLAGILLTGLYAAVFIATIEWLSHLAGQVNYTLGSEEVGLLLSTVVTVCGVVLGLYFTALSAVAGSLFMRAPEDLQRLFLRERKGKQYIRTLALTIIVGLYYLLLGSFGYEVGFIGPVVITLLALYAVVRFVQLGARTFYFIHPVEASSTVTYDARDAINNASVGGFGWKKDYMQNHYMRQATTAFDTLNSLIDFGVDVIRYSDKQFVDIAKYTGALLDYYFEVKQRIPTDSAWFRVKPKHQNWLLADSSDITIALNTGTTLAPQDTKETLWFEEECLDIILKIFSKLVEAKQWDHAHACIEIIISTLDRIGSGLYVDEAKLIIEKVEEAINPVVIESTLHENDYKHGHLALIDSYGRVATGLLVSLIKHMDKRTCADLGKEIESINWNNENSIYKSKLPGKMTANLEATYRGISNEKAIEGKRISPSWYISTITKHQYLIELEKFYQFIKSLHDSVFSDNTKTLIENKKYLPAAHLTERWLEFTSKMLTSGEMLQKLIDGCSDYKMVHDLPWVDIDFDAERTALQDNDKDANDMLIELLPILSALPQKDLLQLPDYFGQAYTFGVMTAYEAAYDNDIERLKKAFPSVLIGALRAHEKLREDTEGWSDESKIIFSTEPLEDILELSGFIKIYSELYENNDLWSICETAWKNYLSAGDAANVISTLAAFMSYRDTVYKIMPKATLRHNWNLRLRNKLNELGLSVERFSAPPPFGSDQTVDHESALIRVLARRSEMLGFEARTVFFITFLSKQDSATGVDFPDRHNIEESILREESLEDEEYDS